MRSLMHQAGGCRRRARVRWPCSGSSLVAAVAAQETGGGIAGTIADAQSAPLPGVTVTLRNEGTNAQLTTVTNSRRRLRAAVRADRPLHADRRR